MLRKALPAATGIAMSCAFAIAAHAQDTKLYAFSSGALTIGKGILQNLAATDPPIKIPVGFYVIKHPKGNVLFDTGNNDNIIKDPSYWGTSFEALKPVNTSDVAIDTQLQKIDLKPDDIQYVVVSHLHLDHGGNVGRIDWLECIETCAPVTGVLYDVVVVTGIEQNVALFMLDDIKAYRDLDGWICRGEILQDALADCQRARAEGIQLGILCMGGYRERTTHSDSRCRRQCFSQHAYLPSYCSNLGAIPSHFW